MKRVISFLLCLCMLSSLCVCFASCGAKQLDLDGYTAVLDSNVSSTSAELFRSAINTIKKKTDCTIDAVKATAGDALEGESKYEILIGDTNRPESAKALKAVKGHGYVITTVGKKLVIVGTTPLLTAMAVEYFLEEMLPDEGSLIAVTKTVVSELEMVEFTNKWSFVYSNRLDGDRDHINAQITSFKNDLADLTGVRGNAMAMIHDKEKNFTSEVLVGLVNREETTAFLSAMDVNSYGVGVQNGKLIVSAFNDTMQAKAFALLRDVMKDSACLTYNEDGEEISTVMLPPSFSRIYQDDSNKTLVTDFPRPDGVQLSGSIDVYNGMEYYYKGDGVTAANYEAYCSKLTAAGYTLYSSNTIEDSIFRIYNNENKNISLYVAYNAFKHAEEQEIKKHVAAFRIISSPLGNTRQLPEDMLAPHEFTKLQDSKITAVRLSYAFPTQAEQDAGASKIFGSLYIVTFEDGSFMVVDGGTTTTTDAKRIYDILVELYKEGHNGNGPTTSNPIRIAAWYLTHGHGDHYGSMVKFINTYCKNYNNYAVTIDRFIANLASDEEYYNSEAGNKVTQYNKTVRDRMAEYSTMIKDAPGEKAGFEYIKVHTGQRFYIANVEFEVMYTHEDLYPEQLNVYNDSSTVLRTSFYYTENGVISGEPDASMLWLGDAQTKASQWMRATHGAALQTEMVQVAHHGGNGCEWEFYQLVDPSVLWWPHALDQYKNLCRKNGNVYQKVDYNITFNLPHLAYIILSDKCNYTMTVTASGANYLPYDAQTNPLGVYDAVGHATISFHQLTASNKNGSMTNINKAYIKALG